MAGFSDFSETGLLNFWFRGQAVTQPTSVFLALFTGDPTDANDQNNEVSDSNYARQDFADGGSIDSGWSAPVDDGAGKSISNAKVLEFPEIADGTVTITHFGLMDQSGNMLASGELNNSRELGIGDVTAVAVGAITLILG